VLLRGKNIHILHLVELRHYLIQHESEFINPIFVRLYIWLAKVVSTIITLPGLQNVSRHQLQLS
jgi:hypothetical protein